MAKDIISTWINLNVMLACTLYKYFDILVFENQCFYCFCKESNLYSQQIPVSNCQLNASRTTLYTCHAFAAKLPERLINCTAMVLENLSILIFLNIFNVIPLQPRKQTMLDLRWDQRHIVAIRLQAMTGMCSTLVIFVYVKWIIKEMTSDR